MELGLWNTLWANSAFCTTFLALPTLPILADQNVQIADDQLRHDHETQTIEFSSSDSEDSDIQDDSDKETTRNEPTDIQNDCSNSDSNSQSSHNDNNNILEKPTEVDVKLNNQNAKRKKSYQRIRYSREEYRCTMCSYTCTTERAFLKHLRSHSSETDIARDQTPDSPRLSCPVCGKDRTGEPALNKHMLKHRDNRYFCCDICSFKTVQLKKLIQHRRMHTGERPHLCPHCVYRAARRDNLRSHVRRVHKKDNLNCDTFSPRGMLLIPSKPTKEDQKTDLK